MRPAEYFLPGILCGSSLTLLRARENGDRSFISIDAGLIPRRAPADAPDVPLLRGVLTPPCPPSSPALPSRQTLRRRMSDGAENVSRETFVRTPPNPRGLRSARPMTSSALTGPSDLCRDAPVLLPVCQGLLEERSLIVQSLPPGPRWCRRKRGSCPPGPSAVDDSAVVQCDPGRPGDNPTHRTVLLSWPDNLPSSIITEEGRHRQNAER